MPRNMTNEAREARFWARVARATDMECWPFLGFLDSFGYGVVQVGRRGATQQRKAHRVSYEYVNGAIPDGMCVLHRCDNPQCVNPSHLFIGTRADNNADKVRKGRQPSNAGETNPRAKLTKGDALAIRDMLKSGMSQEKIATRFGVHQKQISRVKYGYLADA